MAIVTNYDQVKREFKPEQWTSIDEFEDFFLQNISEKGEANYYTDKNGAQRHILWIDHFPELKEYEVWMEGYVATGEHATAELVGKIKARNFAQACHIIMCEKYLSGVKKINDPSYSMYINAGRWDYNPNSISYWGRGLFWCKDHAIKSHG